MSQYPSALKSIFFSPFHITSIYSSKLNDEDDAPFLLLKRGPASIPKEKEISNFGQIISHSGIRDRRRSRSLPRGRSISARTDCRAD